MCFSMLVNTSKEVFKAWQKIIKTMIKNVLYRWKKSDLHFSKSTYYKCVKKQQYIAST